jgi:YHS domain-containing protein
VIRAILFFILLMVIYQAIKSVFRSALESYRRGDGSANQLPGAEMVQDPNCRTYIVKDRSVVRRVNGATNYFCSTACAEEYERNNRR